MSQDFVYRHFDFNMFLSSNICVISFKTRISIFSFYIFERESEFEVA